jgi:hypothetical protein
MLRLTWEQFDRLEQLTLKRHAASISHVLAETWPALTERLGDRWPAFVEAAMQQGRKHGLREARDLARYASLWCIWGPSFDGKPSFAWAAEILADPRRGAALKLHQLAFRTRQELQQRSTAEGGAAAGAAPVLTTAQFESALTGVDARISGLAAARAVFPSSDPAPLALKACDVGVIDMMVSDAENLQEYRHAPNGWQRQAVAKLGEGAVKWTRAPEEPVELAVTSHALRAGAPARLNLRIETHAVCDPRIHPEVVHMGSEGHLAWKGRDTARLSLALYAPSPAPLPAKSNVALPGIAAETPFDLQTVRIASCGLRDAGAPFGEVSMEVRVYDAAQRLAELSHPAWEPMVWPAPAEAAAASAATCRLEKDGTPVDVAAWQKSWRGLQGAFRAGMERLYTEWARSLDNPTARLEVEASPLVGQAGITWGWKRTAASEVAMRTEGVLDLLAFSLELRLSGELVEGAARARIRVHCKGRSELRTKIEQLGAKGTEGSDLKSVLRSWRFPFTLEMEPLAGVEPSTLTAASGAMPITGALVGECGLRGKGEGGGLQWFFALRAEPVTVVSAITDPLLGTARRTHKMVPALLLVDWSAG